jgi:hypothetical protein
MSLEHSPARSGERYAFRIDEFCSAHRISRAKFYLLKKAGKAPRIADVDGVQLITVEDAAVWRAERAAEASSDETATKAAEKSARAAKNAKGGQAARVADAS